jgi:multicomponent Na+:H+ antiporter subunit E
VLALLWLALSGASDLVHLGFGAISVALVAWMTRDLTLAQTLTARRRPLGRPRLGPAMRYPFWLLKEVALANVSIARLILDPRLPIDPVVVRFESRLESSLAQVLLGNSITLTPGTFTIDVRDGIFTVHVLTAEGASGTALGAMRGRVAAVFGENEAPTVPLLDVRRGDEVHTT